MSTRAKVVIFSLVGLLVAGGIAATVVILMIQKGHKDDIAEADRVAAEFVDDVADFRQEQQEVLHDSRDSHDSFRHAIDTARDEVPTLGDAPAYGRENSDDYAEAEDLGQRLLDDLDELEAMTDYFEEVTAYVSIGQEVLDSDIAIDVVGPGPFDSGSHVRDVAVPAMQDVLARFTDTDVPDGFDDAAELIEAALTHVITNLQAMADSLDSGQDYAFEFDPPYAEAMDALMDASEATWDLRTEAIEAFGAGDELPEVSSSSGDDEDDA